MAFNLPHARILGIQYCSKKHHEHFSTEGLIKM